MKKRTITICLAVLSLCSFAQPSALPIGNLSYIPSKSFTSPRYRGRDSVSIYKEKIISTKGFYASRFEVSNKEYRDFVIYVRDSMAHTLLGQFKKGSSRIDWDYRIDWNNPLLEPLMLSPEDRIMGKNEIDPVKIVYGIGSSGRQELISIYPDTLVWISDFSYSYNEPLAKKYFSNRQYDLYPVVGVSVKQAMAFCAWETGQLNKLLKQGRTKYEVIVRLPTNAEWEAAAISDDHKGKEAFPGQKYSSNFGIISDKNDFMVKDYDDDGFFYTAPVDHYRPGANGLYNLKGNIAEWTSEEAGDLMINNKETGQHFIVKGGGWDSNPFYLQTGVCQFFPPTATHSFIGFRYIVCVIKK